METCRFCKKNEANKKNTHYLTDYVIRRCLNQDGCNIREKGLYFDVSSNKRGIGFSFQPATSPERIKEILGRESTEEENRKAQQVPYSVDYMFCYVCEKKFTKIENDFLPIYNNKLQKGMVSFYGNDAKTIREFAYLQIWRTHICEKGFELKDSVASDIRDYLDGKETNQVYPLTISFLETKSDHTDNFVGYATGKNPYVIFMNDLVIQFYDSFEDVNYYKCFGLNEVSNYNKCINAKEDTFKIHYVTDESRKKIIKNYHDYKASLEVKRLFYFFSNKCVLYDFSSGNLEFGFKLYLHFLFNICNVKIYEKDKIEHLTNIFFQSLGYGI